MKKILLLLVVFSLFATEFITAQDKVKFGAQIRPRFQYQDKSFVKDLNGVTFTELRSRFNAKFSPAKDIVGFFQVQDSRIFGTEPSTLASTSNVDVHQAYFQVSKLWGSSLSLKVGRMEIAFGPQRLVGSVGWNNVGRSFDGAILKHNCEKMDVDFFALQTVQKGQIGDLGNQNVYGFYSNFKAVKNYKIQPFFIWERSVPAKMLSRITTGIYIAGKTGGFSHEVEFAYQLGDVTNTVNITDSTTAMKAFDIAAMMAAANFAYKFDGKAKATVKAGVDYLSGNDVDDPSKVKVFNTLYATNHKYYGYMDYFLNIPAHTLGLGLMDIHGGVSFMASKSVKLDVKAHIFNAAQDFTLVDGTTSKSFGSEVDVTCVYTYSKPLKFVAGFSFFSAGDIFKQTRGDELATWAYLMAIVNLN